MGRLGINYQDVTKAIMHILEKGQHPTVDKIREFLGTGSKSTIVNHLRTWRASHPVNTAAPQNSLPPELLELINKYLAEKLVLSSPLSTIPIVQPPALPTSPTDASVSSSLETETSALYQKLQCLELRNQTLLQERIKLRSELKKLKDEICLA